MKRGRWLLPLASAAGLAAYFAVAPPAVDDAFREFWAAKDAKEAAAAAGRVVRSGAAFDEAFRRLRIGRPYSPDVPRGVVRLTHRLGSTDFAYMLEVPKDYDPARTYQVRVQLHGGINNPDPSQRGNGIGALAGAEQIYMMPTAWAEAPWWSPVQLENLRTILDGLKRTYNVDENHVAVSGVSDGATATYYVAMRDATPYASFLPLNGDLMVLAQLSKSDGGGIDGGLYPNNLVNRPFFIVNGARDPRYPADMVEPDYAHLKEGGVALTYTREAEGVHNTAWWPEVKGSFEDFVRGHARRPYPDRLTWETDLSDGSARAHWLVVDELAGPATGASEGARMPDLNELSPGPPPRLIFHYTHPSGRVDLVREGNLVNATTRGVRAFTLLLSPDVFDFGAPVKIVANGRTVFEGSVARSVRTLMAWAARDNDRTMLFGAEVQVKVEP